MVSSDSVLTLLTDALREIREDVRSIREAQVANSEYLHREINELRQLYAELRADYTRLQSKIDYTSEDVKEHRASGGADNRRRRPMYEYEYDENYYEPPPPRPSRFVRIPASKDAIMLALITIMAGGNFTQATGII